MSQGSNANLGLGSFEQDKSSITSTDIAVISFQNRYIHLNLF